MLYEKFGLRGLYYVIKSFVGGGDVVGSETPERTVKCRSEKATPTLP